MGFLLGVLVCLCLGSAMAGKETYKAGVVRGLKYEGDVRMHIPSIYEAGKANVDVIVLPSPKASSETTLEGCCGIDNYDELVATLSEASKAAGVYVVAHLLEKTRCQGRTELIRSNIVFDREGNIVSVYRKPINSVANCTTAATSIGTFTTSVARYLATLFTTDFGATFGVLMEEDLVLLKLEDVKDVKNFVLTGAWSSEIPFLRAEHFAPAWAFVNRVNLISSAGIFGSQSGSKTGDNSLEIADLNVEYKAASQIVPSVVTTVSSLPTEDLSLYIIRPVDLVASTKGYEETVCHGRFCCNFYIKTKYSAKQDEINYGVAVFGGTRGHGPRDVGLAVCALLPCAGSYKRSCSVGSENNTNVEFEKISITGNFSFEDKNYPIILTSGAQVSSNQFQFESSSNNNIKQVTLEVENVKNLLNFGIFSRDYTKDTERQQRFVNMESDSPGYIISGDMEEFYDYIWIRLRIAIFLVSIYVLEML